ncbi:SMC familyC-terminal domain containing protein, partial [Aphelenchoides avenae]
MAPARRKPAPRPTPAKRRKKAAANEAASLDTAITEGTESMDLGDEGMDDPDEDLLNMPIPEPPQPCMSADGTGERLMITHVEMENFKSYFGRQTLGPFHKNFTAIIGPNGSGKSNVIDSLLFVFGYRASKIRSKKISVLIHSSAGHDHINSCTVWVHFQKVIDVDRTEYQVVEGSQFVVSRTAYRDNSSRYAYNGRTVQFKELAVILRTSGIDLIHNRFLILQ